MPSDEVAKKSVVCVLTIFLQRCWLKVSDKYVNYCTIWQLAGSDSFAVEKRKAQQVIEWMNAYATKNNHKFECNLAGYSLQTVKFGDFEMVTWGGDWSTARNIIQKASKQLRAKVIESGYHEKRPLLSAMFGSSSEYGKIYSNGKHVGQIEMNKKAGRWVAKTESYI